MKIEIFCDVHSSKICDVEYDKNVPVYVPPCVECLQDVAKEMFKVIERKKIC